eukprot:m.484676 g.484676  ORF g.484676 m.484676 type:complete len:286 (-) comp23497_c0_seq1:150-1007(-)
MSTAPAATSWRQSSTSSTGSVAAKSSSLFDMFEDTPSTNTVATRWRRSSPSTSENHDTLLCEGYLHKDRGLFRKRRRWFRLTRKTLSFYETNGGTLISTIASSGIHRVESVGACQFDVVTKVPFGRSGQRVTLLVAPSTLVRDKWVQALDTRKGVHASHRATMHGELIAEGYLTKIKPDILSRSRSRWFVLTKQHLAYYEADGGAFLGSCCTSDVDRVERTGNCSILVAARAPFTRTGAAELLLKCESEQECEKWLACLQNTMSTTASGTAVVAGFAQWSDPSVT